MRIFLDTNVLFASLINPQGTPAKLLNRGRKLSSVELISSQYVWEELSNVIKRKARHLQAALSGLSCDIQWLCSVSVEGDFLDLKPKDLPIYRAALFHQCDVLVTGDRRDFSFLEKSNPHKLIRIYSPKACYDIIHAQNNEFFEGQK